MSAESGSTRWWENYLPRYLMPSIAGVALVNWLCSYGNGLRSLLSLPPSGTPVDAASLTLLFLYGNLFCYVASYPVLVFHATRVMDSCDGKWPRYAVVDGYIVTLALTACVFSFHYVSPERRYWLAFLAAGLVSVIQLGRLWNVSAHRFKPKGHGDFVSPVYFYTYVLAHRRGIPAVQETEKKGTAQDSTGGTEKPSTKTTRRGKKSQLHAVARICGVKSSWIPTATCVSMEIPPSFFY